MTCLEARRIAKSLGFAVTLYGEGGEPRPGGRVMSILVTCPRCDGFGLIDVDHPQGNLPRDTPSSRPCPRCGGTDRFHVGRGRGGAASAR